MVNLKLSRDGIEMFNESFYNRLNLVVGDSGTGKTFFMQRLLDALSNRDSWDVKCNKNVATLVDGMDDSTIMNILDRHDNIIIMDEVITKNIRMKNSLSNKLSKSRNYFLMLDRSSDIKFEVNVDSVYRINKYRNHMKLHEYFKKSNIEIDINSFNWLVSEDTESGFKFWSKCLSKINVIKVYDPGSGGIEKTVIDILSKHTDGKVLIALDYDRSAQILKSIITNIDVDRVAFISMEAFEEVVCNSEFVLHAKPILRDKVVNYKEYMTCDDISTGKYFSKLLYNYLGEYNPNYKKASEKYIHFYSKGMKNFEQCFIHDCCDDNKEDCFMYFKGDKKKAMLANKFEIYRELI